MSPLGDPSRVCERVAVDLVDGELAVERREARRLSRAGHVARPGTVGGSSPDLDLAAVVRHEGYLFERRDAPVVFELLSAIVVLGRRAQHLHDDARVHHGVPAAIVWIALEPAANDRDVGIGPQSGRQDAHAEVRAFDPTPASAELYVEECGDVAAHGRVLGSRALHGRAA